MANLIQIKRSLTTATAPSLANGELAFTANGDHLFIGSNGSSITIGGKFSPGVLTANQALVANGTSEIDKIIVANAIVTTVTANGVTGTAGQILTSNGTVSYWANPANSSFTVSGDSGTDVVSTGETLSFVSANGLTTAVTDNQVAFSVDTGSTLTVNASGVHVNSANISVASSQLTTDVALGTQTSGNYVATITAGAGISGSVTGEGSTPTIAVVAGTNGGLASNSTGVFVVTGDGLVSNATGVHIVGANGINVVADAVGLTTGSTLTVNATGVHVNSALSIQDLTLSGNLTVTGTLTTIDTTNLIVQDPMIKLANGNVTADAIDIGFFGVYDNGTDVYAGLYRDATDGLFKFFKDSEVEPTTTVDQAATGYAQGTVLAYLQTDGLVANSTAVTLTSNTTFAVNITANSVTLDTPLAGTSGGTGLNTYTSQDILVANSSNGFDKLGLGTDGFLLQSNGTALVYSSLDGGTF